jgi:hypothetical protein
MSTQEQIDLICGPQAPLGSTYFDTTQIAMAKKLGAACPPSPPTDLEALNEYALHLQYYDLGKSLYTVYRRTGDPLYLSYARNAVDSWWKHPWIGEGKARPWPDSATPPPRHAGIGGLILRALDGRPEMFDFCAAYTQANLNIWLKWRLTNAKLHVDIREGAFTFHYATWLSQVLPDSYPLQAGGTTTNGAAVRAQLQADLEKITIDYYQRLQFPCGCWRYDDFNLKDADGGNLIGVTQPFTIGLLLLAFADFHQTTTNATVRESLKNMILKAARHLWVDGLYRKDDPIPFDPSKRWRSFWYLFHGGTTVNPTKFEKGGWSYPGNNADEVRDARQSLGPVIGIYGYAYKISGDPIFLEAAKELWDSAYGDTDSIRTYYNTDGKGFSQHVARAGSTWPWAGTVAPLPAPAPIPTPSPMPSPIPSPDGTKGISIIDSQGGTWTIGSDNKTLRNGVHMGNGQGTVYKYVAGVVYVWGGFWYKWTGTGWAEFSRTEPGLIMPSPAPNGPVIGAIKSGVPWGESDAAKNQIAKEQRANGWYYHSEESGDTATFIYTGVKLAT